MLKPRKVYKVDCFLHPVKIKGVTNKHLDRIAADLNETVRGCYVSKENTIYIAYDLAPEIFIHTFWHEYKHAFDDQTAHLNEEDVADAFGAVMVKLGADPLKAIK